MEVYPSTPLPEYNAAGGPAFAARFKSDANSDLIAILCNSGLPTRFDLVNSVRSIDHPCVMRIVESGVITWPDGTRYAAFAYQRPTTPRFKQTLDETHPVLNEDVANRRFIQPLAARWRSSCVPGSFTARSVPPTFIGAPAADRHPCWANAFPRRRDCASPFCLKPSNAA